MKIHLALCVPLILLTIGALEADDQWHAGFAERKITPNERVYLAGYASRNKPFESVSDDLYVKAMALEDASGNRAVLITSDLIGYRAEFAEPICRRIQERTQLERRQILLNSSHTHTGPDLSLDEKMRARDMTAEQTLATVAYTKEMMELTVEAAVDALEHLEPATLSISKGVAGFVMNRREFTEQGVRLGVNPSGLADRSVPVLRIDDADGNLRAVLFGAACHNTTLGSQDYMVSGDYAGAAQRFVQSKHPGVQAMFMLGCAGSANPYPRGSLENVRDHGEALGTEVCRVLDEKRTTLSASLHTAFDYVDLPLQSVPSEAELNRLLKGNSGWEPWVAAKIQETIERDGKLPSSYRCPVALWQLGDLRLVALSGEVVVDYVPLIERALGPLNLWIAAYCNDVFGYLPSAQVLSEGGYETRGMIYGGIGFFSPTAQVVLVKKIVELAANRPLSK